jgi:tripartite-type tricarboxylate transporter receptor subunit TctC
MPNRLRSAALALLPVLVALPAAPAHAQAAAGAAYPVKTVRLIVPWPAGGTTDIVGRVMAQKLGESLGQSVVVDNRPGASGSVGTEAMVRAPADGHTLLVSSMGTHTMNQFLQKLAYDPVEDVAPVSMLVDVPAALVAHPSLPLRTVREVVAAAKARPGHLNVASGSNAYQLFLELFKSTANIRIEHVRYRGAGPAMNDLLGGQIEMLITGLPAITPHAKLGKLRVIGVTNAKRATAMPDVPTFGETLPGVEFNNWTAIFARAGTPGPVIDRLNAEAQRILALPDVRERFLGLGAEPVPSTSQALARTLKQDAARWGKLIKATGMQPD